MGGWLDVEKELNQTATSNDDDNDDLYRYHNPVGLVVANLH